MYDTILFDVSIPDTARNVPDHFNETRFLTRLASSLETFTTSLFQSPLPLRSVCLIVERQRPL